MYQHGPVDVVVLASGEPRFDGRVLAELERQVASGTIKVLDTTSGKVGTVAGAPTNSVVASNRDILSEITIPLGNQHAIDYDFAEAQPAAISGRRSAAASRTFRIAATASSTPWRPARNTFSSR